MRFFVNICNGFICCLELTQQCEIFSAMFAVSFRFYYTEKMGISNKLPAFALPLLFQPTFEYASLFLQHDLFSAITLSPRLS